MHLASLFIIFELGKIKKYFATKTLAKSITSALFLLVLLFVGAGIYLFFVSGFRFIIVEANEEIRSALSLYLYEMFLAVLGGMIVLSATISGVFLLFKGKAHAWIMSTPSYRMFPHMVFFRGLLSGVLPIAIVFIPALLASMRVHHFSIVGFLGSVISIGFLIMLLAFLTLTSVILISFLYTSLARTLNRRSTLYGLVGILFALGALVLAKMIRAVSEVDLIKLFKAETIDGYTITLSTIGSHFYFLPTHPFAMQLVSLQIGDYFGATEYFLITGIATVFSGLLFSVTAHLFYPSWKAYQEGSSRDQKEGALVRKVYYFFGGRTLALFKKEALISGRNMKGLMWMGFLIVIWLAQIGANIILRHTIARYEVDVTHRAAFLQAIQFIIAIYFMASFTLRFVFPAFSAEKKTSWLLGSAPLSFKKIFFGKYFFYTTWFVIMGTIMSAINNRVLNVPLSESFVSTSLLIIAIITIVTFGLVLGAFFPNKESDDPEVISTSMPGLFFTGIALLYGALCDGALYLLLVKHDVMPLLGSIVFSLSGIVLMLSFIFVKRKWFLW